jgi:small subunit ribosomal protein S17
MSDVTPEAAAEDAAPAAPETAPEAETAPATPPAPAPAPVTTAEATSRVNRRKVREGLVSSSTMEKTVVVDVIERVRHPRYAKTVQRTKHFYAHDEGNEVRVGDRVRIQETRPMSKLKRWRVVEVLERAR